jgi:O-antigen/teichoic acid export membrane protein
MTAASGKAAVNLAADRSGLEPGSGVSARISSLIRRPQTALQAASVASLAAAFLTGKLIAVILGPAGVGYQSALLSGGSLTALFATWGISNTLPALTAHRSESGEADFSRAIVKATSLALPMAFLLIGFAVLPQLVPPYDWPVAAGGLAIAALASVMLAIRPIALSVFVGSRAAALNQIVAAVVATLAIATGVLALPHSLLPVIIGGGLFLGQVAGWIATRSGRRTPSRRSPVPVGWMIRDSWPVFSSAAVSAAAMGAVPLIVLALSGAGDAGLFRASMSLGGLPASIILTSVSLHYYPKLAGLVKSGDESSEFTILSVRSVVGLACLGSSVLALFGPLLLWAAYSRQFLVAAGALAFIAAAGPITLLTFHNAYLLLVNRRRRAYLGSEVAAAAVLVALVVLAAKTHQIAGVGAAWWATYWIHFLLTRWLLRNDRDRGARINGLPIGARAALALLPLVAIGWTVIQHTTHLIGGA